jgi:hypothetical protein
MFCFLSGLTLSGVKRIVTSLAEEAIDERLAALLEEVM